MFLFLFSLSFSVEFNLCYYSGSNGDQCPSGYEKISYDNFNDWTTKVDSSTETPKTVSFYFVNSMPSGNSIVPNKLLNYVDTLNLKSSSTDISINLETNENFVMIESLSTDTIKIVLSTTTLSCDKVTSYNTKFSSKAEGTLTCDSFGLNGDIESIIVFHNQIKASTSNIKLTPFNLQNSVVLDFTNTYKTEFTFTDILSNMIWTGLPDRLQLQFAENANTITIKIHNIHPTISCYHETNKVQLTLIELASVGVSLIRSIQFVTIDGSILDFPYSLDTSIHTLTINASTNSVIKQEGQCLGAEVSGSSYSYDISSSASNIDTIQLGTSVNLQQIDENSKQTVLVNQLKQSVTDNSNLNANGSSLTVNITELDVQTKTNLQGSSTYYFTQLLLNNELDVKNLLIDDSSNITFSVSQESIGKIVASEV